MPNADKTAAAAAPKKIPSHIILLCEYGNWPSGKVLAADLDLVAALDVEKVPYREATPAERSLGGFTD